jgi:hypothetical protein
VTHTATTHVIPALVAGIHLSNCADACGWLDTGDKPRYDRGMQVPASNHEDDHLDEAQLAA